MDGPSGASAHPRAAAIASSPRSPGEASDPLMSSEPPPTAPKFDTQVHSSSLSAHLPALVAALIFIAAPVVASIIAHASPKLLAPLIGFRLGPVTPAACRLSSRFRRQMPKLPTLYYVAGVEGSGHPYFNTLFALVQDKMNITIAPFDPDLHVTAAPEQVMDSSKAGLKNWRGCPKLPYSRQVYDFGAEITARLAALQEGPGIPFRGLYARSRDTSPLGGFETPLARPDLVALLTFHGIMYKLKVIVIVREPGMIAMERIRNKTYADDPGLLFRVTEDSLAYLDASVRQLPCETYVAVNFDLLTSPSPTEAEIAVAPVLASFLEIDGVGPGEMQELLGQARSLYVKPHPRRRLLAEKEETKSGEGNSDEEIKSWMKEFEDSTSPRFLLWPLFSALMQTPVYQPQNPRDWPAV